MTVLLARWALRKDWQEEHHPRDSRGRFIEVGAWVRAWTPGVGETIGEVTAALAAGSWQLAAGSWQLQVGKYILRILEGTTPSLAPAASSRQDGRLTSRPVRPGSAVWMSSVWKLSGNALSRISRGVPAPRRVH